MGWNRHQLPSLLESGIWHLDYLLSWRGLSTYPPPPRNQRGVGYFKDKERFSNVSLLELGTLHCGHGCKNHGEQSKKQKVFSSKNQQLGSVQEIWDFPLLGLLCFFLNIHHCLRWNVQSRALNVVLPQPCVLIILSLNVKFRSLPAVRFSGLPTLVLYLFGLSGEDKLWL